MSRSRDAGFTLVEILVAVVILGVVALLAYRATAAMTDGEARLVAESTRWRDLDRFFTRLEADLRQALPRTSRHGAATTAAFLAAPADGAGNAQIEFTRAGSEFALEPGSAGQRIGYRLRDGRVELLYWPALDNVATAEPAVYALAEGVAALRIDALNAAGLWTPRWPLLGESDVPRAVRVLLTLADGTVLERRIALQ